MNDYKLLKKQLTEAFVRLREALAIPTESNPLSIDGTIQRFEFTFELCWKALKAQLEEKGIFANSPLEALQEAYANKLIDNEEGWLALLKARKLTTHTYSSKKAQEIYDLIKTHALALFGQYIQQ